ncbi:response regulator [Undibacterium sp. Ji50W]|uniref:response regulator n=1 Tax=Undibacterium sp. Ji50W TaxID=3413041 RepID=UPI003BF43143
MRTPNTYPRILIVDDEVLHMSALCDLLRDHDCDTTGFVSGSEALIKMRETPFDLLLTDLMMPEFDGIEMVKAARLIDPDLACIIMTGEGTIASAVEAMKVGAFDYIIKPFKISALLPVLSRALEARTLRMENANLELLLHAHVDELAVLNKDLELAKTQADIANRAKSTFLSNMSHELRTPLNAILGFAQILTSETLSTTLDEKREFAQHIEEAGIHLLTLINEILDLAKVESGAMSLSLEPVALEDVFSECSTMIEPLSKKRSIGVEFKSSHGLHVFADRIRLKQILINLLSNAIKYNRPDGVVTVSCEKTDGKQLRIYVQDTGIGLTAAQLDTIFQPFNRLGREVFDEEGTGIGLALVKHLADAMHGKIGISSEIGVGSTFWIELPMSDPMTPALMSSAIEAAVRESSNDSLEKGQKTLLYIEDNPTNLRLVKELMRFRPDFSFLSASDGFSGIEMARLHSPQIILMDINLPGIDGIEARQILSEDSRTAHIPVIALTANAMPSDIEKGIASGFFRYITKPIDITKFTEAIDAAMKLK